MLLYRKIIVKLLMLGGVCAMAEDAEGKDAPEKNSFFSFHFQTTYIYQYKPAFNSPYSAAHSFQANEERQNSLTATLYAGAHLWKWAELYVNMELAGGRGLSGAYGLAASTNGETYRVGDPAPVLYVARGYLKQTIPLSKSYTMIDDMANQVAGVLPDKYLQLVIGKYCLGDFFDNNAYSNSPRTQFMSWAAMNNAAWDYAADVRGYNDALTMILQLNTYTTKLCFSLMPTVPNGSELNMNTSEEGAINAEVDKSYHIGSKAGNIRLLGYYNYGDMGNYKQALRWKDSAGRPDIAATRSGKRHKAGIGINADQDVNEYIGLFERAGWNDGKTETWCYTEADRTLTMGICIKGKAWKRSDDNAGLAVMINGLSKEHRNYLAAGGAGFELGDGRLNYGYETAAELYYSFKPTRSPIWVSADYQYVMNPAYNKDRGPVHVLSCRLHVEL